MVLATDRQRTGGRLHGLSRDHLVTLVNPIQKIVPSGEKASADAARLFKVH